MRLVLQRVKWARVLVRGSVTAEIGPGALILVGVGRGDTKHDAAFLARKASMLRVFDDEQGKMNRSIESIDGSFLVVSQFTLYGDCMQGNRPSYIDAAPPEEGAALYEAFVEQVRLRGHEVRTGIFRETMCVELANDGPVTLILESNGRTTS